MLKTGIWTFTVITIDIGKNSLDQKIIIVGKTFWKGLGLFEHLLK